MKYANFNGKKKSMSEDNVVVFLSYQIDPAGECANRFTLMVKPLRRSTKTTGDFKDVESGHVIKISKTRLLFQKQDDKQESV